MRFLISFIFFCFGQTLISQTTLPPRGEVFRNDVVPEVFIEIAEEDLSEILAEGNEYSYTEFPAQFIFDNGTVRDTVENIGFRLRGNTSRLADKKSFKVSFNTFENQKYRGLQKMNLNGEHNDPSVSRARICWDILRWMELPGSRVNHVRLYVNGDYFGLYANVEHIDDNFIETYFDNDEGDLYKCIYPADMVYKGSNPDLYKEVIFGRRAYQLRTNTERDDYTDFAKLVDVVNNTPLDELECALEEVLHTESFLKCIAFDVLTGNWDGPHYNKNNFYLYKNPATGKFHYIPYDLDNTLGIDWLQRDWGSRDMYDWGSHEWSGRPFYFRTLEVPAFRERFSVYTQEILENWFNEEVLHPYAEAMREQLAPYIPDDPFYPLDYGFDFEDFEDSFDEELGYFQTDYGIKDFVSVRHENSQQQLEIVNTAPIITELRNTLPAASEDIIFTAKVRDENANFTVQLCYSPGNSEMLICEDMLDDGTQNDGVAGDGIFGLTVSENDLEGMTYFAQAIDNEGLNNRIPTCGERVIRQMSDLVINELMASNTETTADETGAFEDWIELYNRGTEAIFLGDYFLTDNRNIPGKWPLPRTDLAAGDYLLIWADNDPEDGAENHATFRLSAAGEEVALFRRNADAFTVTDMVVFPALDADESYARVPNGTGDFASHFSTPGSNNNFMTATEETVAAADFRIYPNPNDGIFTVRFVVDEAPRSLSVYSAQGSLLYRKKTAAQMTFVNLRGYPGQVFFVRITDEGGNVFVRRVVKR